MEEVEKEETRRKRKKEEMVQKEKMVHSLWVQIRSRNQLSAWPLLVFCHHVNVFVFGGRRLLGIFVSLPLRRVQWVTTPTSTR